MWQTVGHDKALRTLDRAIAGDRVAHSYLIVGPAQVGKTTLALDLARSVNCTSNDPPCGECRQCQRISSGLHPDVRVVGLEPARSGRMRTQISIDQVRDVQREASLLPYEGRHRVFIFETAEKLTAEASNSLLKMLEEPPDGVIIVLLASDAGAMLPTILSRCRRIDLRPVPAQTISEFLIERYDMSGERAQEIAGASSGRIGWAVEAARDSGLLDRVRQTIDTIDGFTRGSLTDRFEYAQQLAGRFSANREAVFADLDLWQSWWRDILMTGHDRSELVANVAKRDSLEDISAKLSVEDAAAAIAAVRRAAFLLERNVSPRLALEAMMLALPRV